MATNIIGASFLQSSNSITRNKDKGKKNKFVGDFVLILKNLNAFKNEYVHPENNLQRYYFEERLSMCNLSLFYFLFKNNYSYGEIKKIRETLISGGLYRDSHKVSEKKPDLFRKVMLKNFNLFRITQPLKKILGA